MLHGIKYQRKIVIKSDLYKQRIPFTRFNIPHSISPPTYDAQNVRKRSEKPAFFQYKSTIKVELTAVRVGLWTVSILKSTRPRALVPRRGRGRLSDTVSTLESLRPFAAINPPSTGFHAQTVAFPILPLAFVNRSTEIRYCWRVIIRYKMFSDNQSLAFRPLASMHQSNQRHFPDLLLFVIQTVLLIGFVSCFLLLCIEREVSFGKIRLVEGWARSI